MTALTRRGTLARMVVSVPLGRNRFFLAVTRRGGVKYALWRAGCGDVPVDGQDGDGASGVREPRTPRPSAPRGTIALP